MENRSSDELRLHPIPLPLLCSARPSCTRHRRSLPLLFSFLQGRWRAKQRHVCRKVVSRLESLLSWSWKGGTDDSKLIPWVAWHTFEWTITLPQLTTIVRDRDEKGRGRERRVSKRRGGGGREDSAAKRRWEKREGVEISSRRIALKRVGSFLALFPRC